MKSHLDLSRNQMDFLKGFLDPYIKIPNREYVRNYCNDLLPATSVPTKLEYRKKTGHDGAGNMSIYKSKDMPMQNTNIFSKMFVPLSLKDSTGEVVWRNESPNSSHWCRPLGLIAEKESAELLWFVNGVFEPGETSQRQNGVKVEYNNVQYELFVMYNTTDRPERSRLDKRNLLFRGR
ncbi:unnamed protein product [Didymodactylos carnosus]|uniref:V(D)J recombination-activating protein 1 RNase H domain-containing protein n=1 Tax=Didymodactylos carnosus TaxID=1234261 RepID=A0A814K7K1_9BILA|nr:unnamed protein product [Didymodactylos carnosus]CAF1377954.1 unnamed protein product [Didymodactylos carnosus]CAF3817759.1 unnamed protein product [Didymodactylos carnosus]CAF4186675.1 unnamed protein product [Didymodactylos carnosus]